MPFSLTDATDIVLGNPNDVGYTGYLSILYRALPAAHTNNMLLFSIASYNALFSYLEPQLQFATVAPIISAYSIAADVARVRLAALKYLQRHDHRVWC